tara:strand:+ start:224 stop:913 length:690 start_codon:yes stop_codon:yes gene_type:complete
MNKNKLLIIGSNSDLIQPLIKDSSKYNIETLGLNSKDWDLSQIEIPYRILDKIIRYEPNQILFAAGVNEPIDINRDNTKQIIKITQDHFNVNCLSFVNLCLTLQQRLKRELTSIHILSSLYGVYGRKNRLPYCISKHALEGVIKCLSIEFEKTQVIGYRPGFFKTKMTDKNLSEEQIENLIDKIPSKRLGMAEEISEIILGNIIKPVKYFSGTCITIDGGMTSGGLFNK